MKTAPKTMDTGNKPMIRSLITDILLNATIPLGFYYFSKKYISHSELTALLFATSFPVVKGAYGFARHRQLNPVSVIVLLGIITSILAVFLGGNIHILLIRESFFTGAFGIACLISLVFPRPLMFYFSRYFMTGNDPQKLEVFNASLSNPIARRGHRLVTIVWGLVYICEFVLRVIMVYSLPIPVFLIISPFPIGIATISTITWSFWYAKKVREKIDKG